jgi:hypothetical protein
MYTENRTPPPWHPTRPVGSAGQNTVEASVGGVAEAPRCRRAARLERWLVELDRADVLMAVAAADAVGTGRGRGGGSVSQLRVRGDPVLEAGENVASNEYLQPALPRGEFRKVSLFSASLLCSPRLCIHICWR